MNTCICKNRNTLCLSSVIESKLTPTLYSENTYLCSMNVFGMRFDHCSMQAQRSEDNARNSVNQNHPVV